MPTHDLDLESRVTGFLWQRQVDSLRRLRVKAQGGVVTLTGAVSSYHEKQLALHASRRVAGVLQVVDCVRVTEDSLNAAA